MSYTGMLKTVKAEEPRIIVRAVLLGSLVTFLAMLFLDYPLLKNLYNLANGMYPQYLFDVPQHSSLVSFELATFVLYLTYIYCFLDAQYNKRAFIYTMIIPFGIAVCISFLAYILYIFFRLGSIYDFVSAYQNAYKYNQLAIWGNLLIIGYIFFEFLISPSAKNVKKSKDTFGGAKLGTEADFKKKGMVLPKNEVEITSNNQNYTVGKFKGTYLIVREILNSITYAKPQSDKGVSDVIPFLLECPEPIVATDFKAELIQTASKHRQAVFNKKPLIIDPYNELLKYDARRWASQQILSLNPLDFGVDIDIARYTTIVANAICEPIPTGSNASFYKGARKIVEGILITVLFYRGYLTELSDMLTNSDVSKMIDFLENSDAHNSIYGEKVRSAISTLKKCANEKDELTKYGEAALEIALNSCDFMADPSMYYFFKRKDDVPAERTFNVTEYLKGNADIYLIIPDDLIEFSKKFIALFVGILSTSFSFGKKQKKRKRYPFVIDELAQLGYMQCIEQLYEIGQSKGVRLKLYFQNKSQLHDYKKASLFKGFDIRKFFGINDPDTAKEIQIMAGEQTIATENVGEKESTKIGEQKNRSINTGYTGVKLLTVDKILQLPKYQQILVLPDDMPLTICEKVKYYSDPRFMDCADNNLAIEKYEHLIPKDNQEIQIQVLKERGLFVDI